MGSQTYFGLLSVREFCKLPETGIPDYSCCRNSTYYKRHLSNLLTITGTSFRGYSF